MPRNQEKPRFGRGWRGHGGGGVGHFFTRARRFLAATTRLESSRHFRGSRVLPSDLHSGCPNRQKARPSLVPGKILHVSVITTHGWYVYFLCRPSHTIVASHRRYSSQFVYYLAYIVCLLAGWSDRFKAVFSTSYVATMCKESSIMCLMPGLGRLGFAQYTSFFFISQALALGVALECAFDTGYKHNPLPIPCFLFVVRHSRF